MYNIVHKQKSPIQRLNDNIHDNDTNNQILKQVKLRFNISPFNIIFILRNKLV